MAAKWNWWAFSAKDKTKNLQLHIFCYNQVEDNKVFVLKVHYNAFTQDADRVWVESDTTIRVRKEFFPYFFLSHSFENLPLLISHKLNTFREFQKSKYSQVSYKGLNKLEGLAEVFIFTGLYGFFSVSRYQSHKQPSGGGKVNVRLSQEFIFSSSFSYT